MNTDTISDRDLLWADYVFIGAMAVQKQSAKELISRCREAKVRIVGGGPLFTAAPDDFPEVDHLVLGEAETTPGVPRGPGEGRSGRTSTNPTHSLTSARHRPRSGTSSR